MPSGLQNLRSLAAGQPTRTSLVYASHVLGMQGSVTSTIVLGDGTVKEFVSHGAPADPRTIGKVPVEEVHALARLLVENRIESLKPDPPSGDIHGYMNRRITIDVGGQPDLHVDLPRSQQDGNAAVAAIAKAFETLKAAAAKAPKASS